jgi:Tol biopolymer transport system component
MSWSADGQFLMYRSNDPQTGSDLWVLPMAGDRTPWVFLKTPSREAQGMFSPDGRWVVYQSDESGRPEIYVRAFVRPGGTRTLEDGQLQVTTDGGINPVWGPDGKEVYYLNPAGAMMAAPITVRGSTIESGAPVLLFPTRIVGGGVDALQGRQYDVAPDGRFLINTEVDTTAAPITLLMNWNSELKK